MKKRMKMRTRSLKKSPRLPLVGFVIAAAILATGAITAVSMQTVKVNSPQVEKMKSTTNHATDAQSLRSKLTAQAAPIDSQTGQVRPLTPEEAQQLADGIKELVNQSDEGLKQVQHADGTVSVDLEGRFQNVAVAQKNADGTVSQSCVNSTETAAEFFGIDPERFGDKAKTGLTTNSMHDNHRVQGKGEIK
jgi:hypothetical protein